MSPSYWYVILTCSMLPSPESVEISNTVSSSVAEATPSLTSQCLGPYLQILSEGNIFTTPARSYSCNFTSYTEPVGNRTVCFKLHLS